MTATTVRVVPIGGVGACRAGCGGVGEVLDQDGDFDVAHVGRHGHGYLHADVGQVDIDQALLCDRVGSGEGPGADDSCAGDRDGGDDFGSFGILCCRRWQRRRASWRSGRVG